MKKVTFYMAGNGEYSWRMVSSNGKKLITPGETFKTKAKARKNFNIVSDTFMQCNWVEAD
jgi:uncharacterized protein YegP (UPF0339 family)